MEASKHPNNNALSFKSTLDNDIFKNFKLILADGIENTIVVRKDGFINATELSKYAGKLFADYSKLKTTKNFLNVISYNMKIAIMELVASKVGGNHTGTWIHRKVAYHFCQWLSPHFAYQVTNILDELLLTGKVELSNEKSSAELDAIWQEKYLSLENEKLTLENTLKIKDNELKEKDNELIRTKRNHNAMLTKRQHYKFKKGNCFYLLSDKWRGQTYFKFGIAEDFNQRLAQHRTDLPRTVIEFLAYLNEHKLMEDNMKRKFNAFLADKNHEYVYNIDVNFFIKSFIMQAKFLDVEFTVEKELYKYNMYVAENDEPLTIEDNKYDNINSIEEIETMLDLEEIANIKNTSILEAEEESEESSEGVEESKEESEEEMETPCEEPTINVSGTPKTFGTILKELGNYLGRELAVIAEYLKISKSGTKDKLSKKIKEKINEIWQSKLCITCKNEKELSLFRITPVTKKYVDTCIECEKEKCKKPETEYKEFTRTLITPGTKTYTCKKCNENLSIDDFDKNKSKRSGHDTHCKKCRSIDRHGNKDGKVRLVKTAPVVEEDEKWCPKCENVKLKTDFCKAPSRPDGLQHSCKECDNERKRNSRLEKKLRIVV